MNVLFISPNSPFESIGGVERYISNLINFCTLHTEFNSFILLPSLDLKSNEQKAVFGNIYFENFLQLDKNSSSKQTLLKTKEFSRKIEALIIENKIDIIVAENFHIGLPPSFSLTLNMVAGLHKIPLLLRLHSFASTELQVELVNQLMWKKISCVSKSVTGDCFQKGADINNLSTEYLGVDTNIFNTKSKAKLDLRDLLKLSTDEKIILTATRILQGRKNIIKEKGIINLIQAFSKLVPTHPNLRLLIAVGKPPDNLTNEFNESLNMLMGYLKLNNVDSKTIVKMFRLDEMADVYRQSDIFALPSENETFGQVFIEAMSCGLPVIGTKTGGIPEIINDGYNGYLIPTEDSTILAQKIEILLDDNTKRNDFIDAGVKTVEEKFTAEKQFINFYKLLVSLK